MHKGRPRLPGTAEERAAARRQKVLQNVRAYRARKKDDKCDTKAPSGEETASSQTNELAESVPLHRQQPSYSREDLTLDISHFSSKAPIDLSFDFDSAVVNEFQSLVGRYPFMMTLNMFQTPDRIVSLAAVAAAAATLSASKGDKQLENLGLLCYNTALQVLQRRVKSANNSQFPMLAVVSNSLMSYESANGSERVEKSPWGAHALGSALFFQLAGPAAYCSDPGRALLRSHRPTIIQICVYARKRCFLDHDVWRQIPFQGVSKTAEDHIWEIAARLPGHMVDAEILIHQIRQHNQAAVPNATELIVSLSATIQNYKDWLQSFYMNPLNRPVEAGLAGEWFSRHLQNDVFQTCFSFANAYVSELHMVYWSSLLNLHILAGVLQYSLRFAGLSDIVPSCDTVLTENPEELANNICKSMEYCIGPNEADLSGMIYAGHLPLQAATRYFKTDPKRYEQQIRWCNSAGAFVSSRGLHTRDYLNNPGAESLVRQLYNFTYPTT